MFAARTDWSDPLLAAVFVVAVGATLLVVAAATAGRLSRSAVVVRALWQAAVVGIWGLVLLEFAGAGPAVAILAGWQTSARAPAKGTGGQHELAQADGEAPPPSPAPDLTRWHALAAAGDGAVGLDGHAPGWHERDDLPQEAHWLGWDRQLALPWGTESPGWHAPADAGAETASLEADRPAQLDRVADEDAWLGGAPWVAGPTEGRAPSPPPIVHPPGQAPVGADAGHPVRAFAVVLWLGAALLLAGRMVVARGKLAVALRGCRPVEDPAIVNAVHRLGERLGVRGAVRLLQWNGLVSPMAVGSWRPTILLPASFAREYREGEREAVLAHELAHLAGRDGAWQAAADLLAAVLWWHPAVWYLARRLRRAAEWAADEASLVVPQGPEALADCLVGLGRRLALAHPISGFSVTGPPVRSSLGRRVERLLSLEGRVWRRPRPLRLLLARTFVATVVVAVVLWSTAWARPQVTFFQGESTMAVLSSSWRSSLAAVALAALLGPAPAEMRAEEAEEEEAAVEATAEVALQEEREKPPRERDEAQAEREREGREAQREAAARAAAEERERAEGRLREARERIERAGAGLRERAADLERALGELGHERGERAAELRAELERVRERMAGLHRELQELRPTIQREGPPPAAERVERRVDELRDQVRRAVEAGRYDLAERLEQEIERLKRTVDRVVRPDATHRERIEQRVDELRAQLHKAVEAGRHDLAERLEREIHELRQMAERGPAPPRRPEVDAAEQRMRHVRVAVDNLRAAGLHDLAERVLAEARRPERAVAPPTPPRGRPYGLPPAAPAPEQAEMLRELHHAVQELRREVQELREQVHRR